MQHQLSTCAACNAEYLTALYRSVAWLAGQAWTALLKPIFNEVGLCASALQPRPPVRACVHVCVLACVCVCVCACVCVFVCVCVGEGRGTEFGTPSAVLGRRGKPLQGVFQFSVVNTPAWTMSTLMFAWLCCAPPLPRPPRHATPRHARTHTGRPRLRERTGPRRLAHAFDCGWRISFACVVNSITEHVLNP